MNARPYDTVKRILDFAAAAAGLVVLSPILVGVAIAVRAMLGRPVIFRQQRPGKDEKTFTLLKFRSMLDVDESRGRVTNEERLTPFGRWLRATSLDELPSLVNVMRGELSIVGPRPLRVDYLHRYTQTQARRHEVRPGITGLAQVRGRNSLTWEDRLMLDVDYVNSYGPIVDARIIGATIARVLDRGGVSGDGLQAMSAFMGTEDTPDLVEHEMSEEWIATRVEWLCDPRIRSGVSISFWPNVEQTRTWLDNVRSDPTRRDWIYTSRTTETAIAMCGLQGVGTSSASLYLYVNPDLHGQGYGTRSLSKLVTRARSFGIRQLHLEAKANNLAALRIYERAGFIQVANHELPEGKIRMWKDLTAKQPDVAGRCT